MEDVAIAQYSPGIILPLSLNSTISEIFLKEMDAK